MPLNNYLGISGLVSLVLGFEWIVTPGLFLPQSHAHHCPNFGCNPYKATNGIQALCGLQTTNKAKAA
jgi:hypothetical protein